MANRIAKVLSGTTGCASLYVVYDYNTCHPMRKMQGYDMGGALIRLHNLIVRQTRATRTMSLSDLAPHDGRDGRPIYFSSDGWVWDASSSEMFRESYGLWAGKDATVALAKMSLDPSDVNRTDWDSLSADDLKSLHSWTEYFSEKYLIKGRIKEFERGSMDVFRSSDK